MYIIELISLIREKIKNGEFKFAKNNPQTVAAEEKCEHIFVPVDSTKKVLACSKCGFIIKACDIKKQISNPFDTKN